MGWDGMGWDGMGWVGLGRFGMSWDGMVWCMAYGMGNKLTVNPPGNTDTTPFVNVLPFSSVQVR